MIIKCWREVCGIVNTNEEITKVIAKKVNNIVYLAYYKDNGIRVLENSFIQDIYHIDESKKHETIELVGGIIGSYDVILSIDEECKQFVAITNDGLFLVVDDGSIKQLRIGNELKYNNNEISFIGDAGLREAFMQATNL